MRWRKDWNLLYVKGGLVQERISFWCWRISSANRRTHTTEEEGEHDQPAIYVFVKKITHGRCYAAELNSSSSWFPLVLSGPYVNVVIFLWDYWCSSFPPTLLKVLKAPVEDLDLEGQRLLQCIRCSDGYSGRSCISGSADFQSLVPKVTWSATFEPNMGKILLRLSTTTPFGNFRWTKIWFRWHNVSDYIWPELKGSVTTKVCLGVTSPPLFCYSMILYILFMCVCAHAFMCQVSSLLDKLHSTRQQLHQMWHVRKLKLDQCFQLRLFEQDAEKVRKDTLYEHLQRVDSKYLRPGDLVSHDLTWRCVKSRWKNQPFAAVNWSAAVVTIDSIHH